MTPQPVPQRLALVGAGSLGQSFAGLLAANGQEVTVLATPGTADRLLRAGRIAIRGVLSLEVPVAAAPAPKGVVGVTANPKNLPRDTGLIFATKGHQLPEAIAAVRAVWPAADDASSWVAGIQNGIVKDDLLAAAFGEERRVGAVTILGAQRDPEGTPDGGVAVTSRGATYLGELAGGSSPRVAKAVELLKAAGIPTEEAPDIRSVVWSKECNAVGVFGVCVLVRSSAPGLMSNPNLMRAYRALIHEVAAVAAAYDVRIGDYVGFPIRTYLNQSEEEMLGAARARAAQIGTGSRGSPSLPSMVQDLLAGRPMEVEQIFADVVERADRVGVPVPRIEFVRDVIRGIDPGQRA
jgi:2-dehydropantoate 2-reductase